MPGSTAVVLSAEGYEGEIKTGGKTFAVALRDYSDRSKLIASRHADTGGVRAALNSLGKRDGDMSVYRAWVFHLPSGALLWSGNPRYQDEREAAADAAYAAYDTFQES